MIDEYRPLVDAVIARYKPRLDGKTVMLYVGGLRPRHVINAYEDLGMEIVGTGYEFGHNDDYQRTGHYVKKGTLIYDDVTGYELEKFVEKIRPTSSAPASRRSTRCRRWASRSVRCIVGLFRPLSRLRRLRDLRARHGPGDQQSGLGPVRRAMGEARASSPIAAE